MILKRCLLSFYCVLLTVQSFCQQSFYDIETVQEIKIYFEESNWDAILDDLFIAGDKERLTGRIIINGTELTDIGVRYKGFSSFSVDRKKNPFNIKLDHVIDNQKYDGIDKIKLSNVIQDPSFLREALSYEIGRKYMPTGRANFANVYVNDEYLGLYTNVEAVNKDFTEFHFGSRNNPFFKCQPDMLDLDGENANLSTSPGTTVDEYMPFYDIESDEGWEELLDLITTLDNNIDDLPQLLNIDRALWMHAFNYVLINFDSYVGYAQNYYLYQDDNGRFNPIPWDLNMSFASYRITDASEHFDGFSIDQAKTMDPLLHYSSISILPRPLMRKLFEQDRWRKMYIAHIRTITEEMFASGLYKERIAAIQAVIEEDVLNDENKFYSNDDFYTNANSTVTDLIQFPGLTDLMDARTEYLRTYSGYSGAPEYLATNVGPSGFEVGDMVTFTCQTTDADLAFLWYRATAGGVFEEIQMYDDGMHNDGNANDGIFGVDIEATSPIIEYYFFTENASSGRFSPERAAYEYYQITSDFDYSQIVINEIAIVNTNGATDAFGEYEDWIELYNSGESTIPLGGLYLSDNADNLTKWALPSEVLPADTYKIIWADSESSQGNDHANFSLSNSGESLFLSDLNGTIIDSVVFDDGIEIDRTFSRIPNGTGPFAETPATFGTLNNTTSNVASAQIETFTLYPNPAIERVKITCDNTIKNIVITDLQGRIVLHENSIGSDTYELVLPEVEENILIIKVSTFDAVFFEKLLIAKE